MIIVIPPSPWALPKALDRAIVGVLPSCRNHLAEEEYVWNEKDIKPESTVRRARTICQEWMTYKKGSPRSVSITEVKHMVRGNRQD